MACCQSLFVTIYNKIGNPVPLDNSTYVSFGSQGSLWIEEPGHHLPHYHEGPMTTLRGRCAHPIELAAVGAVAAVRLVRAVLVPVLALVLVLAGYRPAAPAAVASMEAPAAVASMEAPAAALTVVQLRQMARAAGHRALARSGRRVDLLAALSLA